MTSSNTQRLKYIVGDYIGANIGWIAFIYIRYELTHETLFMQSYTSVYDYFSAYGVRLGLLLFPLLMIFIAYLSGYYNTVYVKSRTQELATTFFSSFCASMTMFFIIMINDIYVARLTNYELILSMWASVFLFLYMARSFVTSRVLHRIHTGQLKFSTLIVGNNKTAKDLTTNLRKEYNRLGYDIIGIVRLPTEEKGSSLPEIPIYELSEMDQLCSNHNFYNIIIAPENLSNTDLLSLINKLFAYNIPIKLAPELYDILTSRVRHSSIFNEPLIDIAQSSMSDSQKCIKRMIDLTTASIALVLLSPLFAIVAALIKKTSPGPVIYKQERIGRHGDPFFIYKFRTMQENAEQDGKPQLSSSNDSRITPVGKVLRKYRIDEIPQFWNVLKGDMSLVGPRPERRYFINQIIEKAPYYTLVYQIRPGITSLGMVKFGYAVDIDEMIERSKYDIIYIDNMSLLLDLKIIAYTIRTVVTGKGL